MADFPTTPEAAPSCRARLQHSRRITPQNTDEVRHLVLSIQDPAFRYLEGQTIGVLVPGPHAFGNTYHHRRYSIANARPGASENEATEIELLVRRCFYVDEVSGERYPGIASNYLCDAAPGTSLLITGPYRSPFRIPADNTSNLLMIGTGTGIAPFRGFIQRIYNQVGNWQGQVRLFYGARTGLDLYYMNEYDNDLANYYDEATFKAFQAIYPRPLKQADQALERSLSEHAAEAWALLGEPNTYVYLAGIGKVAEALDKIMSEQAGSAEAWGDLKERLTEAGRWAELLYA